MRKLILLFCVLSIVGCASGKERIQGYFDNPRTLIKDAHFTKYQQNREILEEQYLNKEITYGEYLKRKKDLDGKYAMEIQKQNDKLEF